MSLNRVVLIGRLVADPESRYTPTGMPVAQMRIAVDRITKDDQGNYETDFFNLVAFRRTAEYASNYLKKGRLVSIDGRLQTRRWTAQDGTPRTAVEVIAESIQGLDRRGDEAVIEGGAEPAYEEAPAPAPTRFAPAAAASSTGSKRTSAPPPPADDDADEADPFADE